jgi:hypothetical protein
MTSQYLKLLRLDPQFRKEMEAIRAKRPPTPSYDWRSDNTREITHALAMQQGFDLALSLLMESK